MLDTLAKIYDDGGRLVSVTYALFENDPKFITAIGLQFESLSAIFRAVPDDDTLAVSLGRLIPEADETLINSSNLTLWSACIGFGISWVWRLTNQQGYSDGVRIEFNKLGGTSRLVVELVVVASGLELFTSVPN